MLLLVWGGDYGLNEIYDGLTKIDPDGSLWFDLRNNAIIGGGLLKIGYNSGKPIDVIPDSSYGLLSDAELERIKEMKIIGGGQLLFLPKDSGVNDVSKIDDRDGYQIAYTKHWDSVRSTVLGHDTVVGN